MSIALKPLVARVVVAFLVLCLMMFFTQDIHIMPGLFDGLMRKYAGKGPELPRSKDYQTSFANVDDGVDLFVARLPAKSSAAGKKTALIFHGNGGDVDSFLGYQDAFSRFGYDTYDFDYRGFGLSTGWTRESTIYGDIDRIVDYVATREHVHPDDIVPVGLSLGTGLATYAASKFNSKSLVLVSPYTSIPDVVKETSIFSFLAPFLWTEFPQEKFMRALKNTCVIAAHGTADTMIPVSHTLRLEGAYHGAKRFIKILREHSDHFDIFDKSWKEIQSSLQACEAAR